MSELLPSRFLFDFEFPLAHRDPGPRITGQLSDWTDAERLPALGAIEGRKAFAEVWACWNEAGLYIACRVEGKRRKLRCDPRGFRSGDNLRLCTDMRDTRSARRASRYCQQFYFLPTGGGPRGQDPAAGSAKVAQAREDAPVAAGDTIEVAAEVFAGGYALEAHLPVACLAGFDPAEHPRIGLYYIVEDDDHGQQYLTVGDDLNWYADPSTWATAVLAR